MIKPYTLCYAYSLNDNTDDIVIVDNGDTEINSVYDAIAALYEDAQRSISKPDITDSPFDFVKCDAPGFHALMFIHDNHPYQLDNFCNQTSIKDLTAYVEKYNEFLHDNASADEIERWQITIVKPVTSYQTYNEQG